MPLPILRSSKCGGFPLRINVLAHLSIFIIGCGVIIFRNSVYRCRNCQVDSMRLLSLSADEYQNKWFDDFTDFLITRPVFVCELVSSWINYYLFY